MTLPPLAALIVCPVVPAISMPLLLASLKLATTLPCAGHAQVIDSSSVTFTSVGLVATGLEITGLAAAELSTGFVMATLLGVRFSASKL